MPEACIQGICSRHVTSEHGTCPERGRNTFGARPQRVADKCPEATVLNAYPIPAGPNGDKNTPWTNYF